MSYVIHIVNPPDTPSAWVRATKYMPKIGDVGLATLDIARAYQFATSADAQTFIDNNILASITQFYHVESYAMNDLLEETITTVVEQPKEAVP